MKSLSAQYVITNTGRPLKRAVITTEDDGTIISIEDTTGALSEKHSTEFYNGIIVPGFVNSHCHLELSHLKGHTSKKESRICYLNLLEVFRLDPEKANRRIADIIRQLKKRENLYWCLCPNSNIYIENSIPPLKLLIEEGCEFIIGTDSLASNANLSILEELKTLQLNWPDVPIEDLVSWATINGARALGEQEQFGSIEPGKKPGLLLIENVDLQNMRLLPESFVRRLI